MRPRLLLAFLLVFACASSSSLPPPTEVPIELTQYHVFLPVTIGRAARPSWFLLDTGAQFSAVAQTTVDAMHLVTHGMGRARGAGAGVVRTTFLRDVDLTIGGLRINQPEMGGLPLTPVSLSEGRAIEGILGFTVIREYTIEIDYERRRLRFYDAGRYQAPDSAVVVPIVKFDADHPVVAAELTLPDGRVLPMRMMVDTGARAAVIVNRPFAEKHRIFDALSPSVDAAYGMGIGGASQQRFGRAKRFAFAGFTLDAPVISAALDRAGATATSQVDGLIGAEVLRRFTVTLDYKRRRLLLAPNRALHEPFEFDMAGLAFKAADLKFDRILVRVVLPNSPASEAGLQVDDEVVTIDGRSAAALTIAGIRELFEVPDKRHELHLRRGGRELDVVLVTRRLL
ncbi:MAG TPA: aspartyl protease family protein [Thermoanaerobaculia bacterium]|nr:aspartyl protease family protein [Thermoanaerobaculia bacterium]